MLKTKAKNQTFKTTGIVCATALALCLYAPRAEAFGGLGILGHKSSHKGGVNAIGVHIDSTGKKADIDIVDGDDSQEPTCPAHSFWNKKKKACECEWQYTLNAETGACECPAEKQCGDICCGGDNVCNHETGQCCNEALNYCCSDGQTVTKYRGQPYCCSNPAYCENQDANGNCLNNYYSCCGSPAPVEIYRTTNHGGSGITYDCCGGTVYKDADVGGYDLCCPDGKEPYCYRRNSNGDCQGMICGQIGCVETCMEYEGDVCTFTVCCMEGEEPTNYYGQPRCLNNQ